MWVSFGTEPYLLKLSYVNIFVIGSREVKAGYTKPSERKRVADCREKLFCFVMKYSVSESD